MSWNVYKIPYVLKFSWDETFTDFSIFVVFIFADPPLIFSSFSFFFFDINFVCLRMKGIKDKSEGGDSYSFDGHLGHCTRP